MCIRDRSTVRDKKDFFMRPMSVEQALLVGCNNISEVKWQDKDVYKRQKMRDSKPCGCADYAKHLFYAKCIYLSLIHI